MAVRAKFQLENPDDAVATLTLTATVGEFKALRDEIQSSRFPLIKFRAAIDGVILQGDRLVRCSGGTRMSKGKRGKPKPRRVVLGIGCPWFEDQTVSLVEWGPWRRIPLGGSNRLLMTDRVRLVAEVLK